MDFEDHSIYDLYLDNGSIGNYWDHYSGRDQNDDGIGDTPHIVPGEYITRQDNYPLWREPPKIKIIEPIKNHAYAEIAPNFSIRVIEPNLEKLWYSLDGGISKKFIINNGSIDQLLWDGLLDGPINLTFYANDTIGNLNYTSVMILKDTLPPILFINTPQTNDIFGSYPPSFNIRISDKTLNYSWYVINNNHKYFISNNGTIDSSLWSSISDGQIRIEFYVNDTFGRLTTKYVDIYKDTQPPQIQIISPTEDEIFGETSPSFNVYIIEVNIKKLWYEINVIQTQFEFSSTTFSINQTVWDDLPNGDVYIYVYIEDIKGEINVDYVTIVKDAPEEVPDPEPDPQDNIVPGYNLFLLLMIVFTIGLLKTFKSNLKRKNY